jgi:hypothetical protein
MTGFVGITGMTGYVGNTGTDETPIRNIPTIVSFDDNMNYTRQMLSRQMQANSYITDGALDILALSRGYTRNEAVYTFGKSRNDQYMAAIQLDAFYGTVVSNNITNWSSIANSTTNAINRVVWDGTKWLVTRDDTNSLLYSYNAETFSSVSVSGGKLASVANNSSIYVGIGTGGVFYSYDGLHWLNSASGTALIDSSGTAQIGKVAWNGSLWVAVGYGASYTIIYSSDGINWTGAASNTFFDTNGRALDLVWNGTLWVATGSNSANKLVAYSSDGITWTIGNV